MGLDASTAITISGIQCWDEGTRERFDRSGGMATRIVRCAWSDRIALVFALSGSSSTNGLLNLIDPPATYPDISWMAVEGIEITGEGITGESIAGMVNYQWAVLNITYKSADVVERLAISIDYSGELLCAPRDESSFKWSDDTPVSPEATPGIPITVIDLLIFQKNLPSIPSELIISLVDHVNDNTFEGAAPGKVLYRGARSDGRLQSNGDEQYDLAHRFSYRSVPWNSFFRASTGLFEAVVTNSGDPLFPDGDFDDLF